MTTFREAVLAGTGKAAIVHDALGVRKALGDGRRAIDIFGTIDALGLPLKFSPLDGLLGACVRVENTAPGILVTSRRDLHMQRFTGAHELGHFVLEHEGSLDRTIEPPDETKGRPFQEVEAEAFAAEFLMPKWLLAAIAKRRGWWTREKLASSDVAYQLSLRLAMSYQATCWGLLAHQCVDRAIANGLAATTPKDCKRRVLDRIPLEDPWADVWNLSLGDDGTFIEAGSTDLFVLSLDEHAAAGYAWNTDLIAARGFTLLDDQSAVDRNLIGGPARRRLVLKVSGPGTYELDLTHRRPFAPDDPGAERLRIVISTAGAKAAGEYSPPPKADSFLP